MNVVSKNVHPFDTIFIKINPIKIVAGLCQKSIFPQPSTGKTML